MAKKVGWLNLVCIVAVFAIVGLEILQNKLSVETGLAIAIAALTALKRLY
jgi:hypothetical protein